MQKQNQMEVQVNRQEQISWIKELLNCVPLLKWVRKFSADNLLDNNSLAEQKFNIKTNGTSISIADDTITKLLTTNAVFNGTEITRFNMKQLKELIDVVGNEGELIIPKSDLGEMIVQIKDTVVVVCPLPKQDKKRA